MLGIVETLVNNSHHYGEKNPYLAVVETNNNQVLRATMTPPFGLILSSTSANITEAANLVINDLQQCGLHLPDVSGPKPISEQFAQAWAARNRGSFRLEMAQRLYELREVEPVEDVAGELRTAIEADIPLISKWMIAFNIDCFGEQGASDERITKSVTRGVTAGAWHLWLLAGKPVSMAVSGRPTQHGVSVSGVYTPPEQRRHGYARACVAALSQKLLDQGYQFCSLFTDLANPTSNHIYKQIGYQPVADFDKFKLIVPAS